MGISYKSRRLLADYEADRTRSESRRIGERAFVGGIGGQRRAFPVDGSAPQSAGPRYQRHLYVAPYRIYESIISRLSLGTRQISKAIKSGCRIAGHCATTDSRMCSRCCCCVRRAIEPTDGRPYQYYGGRNVGTIRSSNRCRSRRDIGFPRTS